MKQKKIAVVVFLLWSTSFAFSSTNRGYKETAQKPITTKTEPLYPPRPDNGSRRRLQAVEEPPVKKELKFKVYPQNNFNSGGFMIHFRKE